MENVKKLVYRSESDPVYVQINTALNHLKKVKDELKKNFPNVTDMKFGDYNTILHNYNYKTDVTFFPDIRTIVGEAADETNSVENVKFHALLGLGEEGEKDHLTRPDSRKLMRLNRKTREDLSGHLEQQNFDEFLAKLVTKYEAYGTKAKEIELAIAKKVSHDYTEAYKLYDAYYADYTTLKTLVEGKENLFNKLYIDQTDDAHQFENGVTLEQAKGHLASFETSVQEAFNGIIDNLVTLGEKPEESATDVAKFTTKSEATYSTKYNKYKGVVVGFQASAEEDTPRQPIAASVRTLDRPSLEGDFATLETVMRGINEHGIETIVSGLNTKYNNKRNHIKTMIAYEGKLKALKDNVDAVAIPEKLSTDFAANHDDISTFAKAIKISATYDRNTEKDKGYAMIEMLGEYVKKLTILKNSIVDEDTPTSDVIRLREKAATRIYASKLKTFALQDIDGQPGVYNEDMHKNKYVIEMNTETPAVDDLDDLRKAQYYLEQVRKVVLMKMSLTEEQRNALKANYNSFLDALYTLRKNAEDYDVHNSLRDITGGAN